MTNFDRINEAFENYRRLATYSGKAEASIQVARLVKELSKGRLYFNFTTSTPGNLRFLFCKADYLGRTKNFDVHARPTELRVTSGFWVFASASEVTAATKIVKRMLE